MNLLESQIREITKNEQWHLDNPGKLSLVYNNLNLEDKQGKECYRFDCPNTLSNNTVRVLKETRFTEIPFHYQTDMEMNYIYSGSCTFIINNKEVTLNQGDICIMDADIVHKADYKKEEDIVFNIIFTKEFFKTKFVNWVGKQGILGEFIQSSIFENHQNDKYLIFHTNIQKEDQLVSDQLKTVFNLLIQEYYYPSLYSEDIMEHYFSAIFLLLIQLVAIDAGEYFNNDNKENVIIISVLDYLEKHYHEESCRLKNIAKKLHFSQSYLYQLIRKGTGYSFSQLKTKQQMERAALLLKTTDTSILSIAEEIGCKNRTYFYDKFKQIYHLTPREYREQDLA